VVAVVNRSPNTNLSRPKSINTIFFRLGFNDPRRSLTGRQTFSKGKFARSVVMGVLGTCSIALTTYYNNIRIVRIIYFVVRIAV